MKLKKKEAKELKNWAENIAEAQERDVSEVMDELVKDLKGIANQAFLKHFDDGEKIEHALRILKATHVNPLTQSGMSFEMYILDYTSPKKVTPRDKTKEPYMRADVYGFALCTENELTPQEEEVHYFELPLFGDNSELVDDLEIGETFTAKVNGNLVKGIWELSALDGVTVFKPSEQEIEIEPEEALQSMFPIVPIADAEFNLTNVRVRSDKKLVRGNVTYQAVQTSDSGYTYGRYVVIDDSLDIEDIKKQGGLSIMVDKSQVRFVEGSDLLFLGDITKDMESGYVGMNASVVVPIIPIPKIQPEDIDEPEEEIVDLSSDDEEDDEEDDETIIDLGE